MYKDSYNEKHQVVSLNFEEKTKKIEQQGLRGSFICEECEKRFSYDDAYASELFTYKKASSRIRDSLKTEKKIVQTNGNPTEVSHWSGFDFRRLQSFVFSVLLKAHLWEKVQRKSGLLTENEYQLMRLLYWNVIVIDDSTFPILIINLNKSTMGPMLLLPYQNDFGIEKVYTFSGARFLFHVFRPSYQRSAYVSGLQVRRDGNIWMIHVPFEESGIFRVSLPAMLEIREKYEY